MRENKYDDDEFFRQYSGMSRSVGGLASAGEWPALKKLLPFFQDKTVLDIGCGFGWHCGYAVEQGASRVLGCDISEKMLDVAKEKNASPKIEYRLLAMEDMDFPAQSFDVVISSLAFHYTPDFDLICRKIHDFLTPGGDFVFSAEHPVFTAQGPQDWIYDNNGLPLHWPVDNYFSEGQREACFLGKTVVKYHRTLSTYLNGLLTNGFQIKAVVEPKPDQHMLDSIPGMLDELRRPMMLLVSAQKK